MQHPVPLGCLGGTVERRVRCSSVRPQPGKLSGAGPGLAGRGRKVGQGSVRGRVCESQNGRPEAGPGREAAPESLRIPCGDPAAYFVLLRLARDIAVLGGHCDLGLQAVNLMAETFEIDAYPMKAVTWPTGPPMPPTWPSILGWSSKRRGNCRMKRPAKTTSSLRLKLGEAALAAARKTTDAFCDLLTVVARNRDGLSLLGLTLARKTLMRLWRRTGRDPEANLIVGKYSCLAKGDWDKGIAYLALGSDAVRQGLGDPRIEVPRHARRTWPTWEMGGGTWLRQARTILQLLLQARAVHWYPEGVAGAEWLGEGQSEQDTWKHLTLSEIQARAGSASARAPLAVAGGRQEARAGLDSQAAVLDEDVHVHR